MILSYQLDTQIIHSKLSHHFTILIIITIYYTNTYDVIASHVSVMFTRHPNIFMAFMPTQKCLATRPKFNYTVGGLLPVMKLMIVLQEANS